MAAADQVVDTGELDRFFSQNLILVLIISGLLVVLYVSSERIVHAVVPRMLEANRGRLEEGGVEAAELEKRVGTLETLATTLLRLVSIAGIGIIVIGVFGAWSLLTGLALFFAALTLAGQSILLDYLMGIFIVVEGTFFNGDNIAVGELRGQVENVGLRRTVIRGPDGTVHSISNGELRVVSNRTRIYAAAEVRIRGIREEDLDEVVRIAEDIGRQLSHDPELRPVILEPYRLAIVEDPNDLGGEAVFRAKVIAANRWTVATEMRRRLNRALLEAGIELNKRGVTPRIGRGAGVEPPYVPEPEDLE